MSDDKKRLVVEVESELKDRAKADPRTIREVVESALKREYMTGACAGVERRIEEKQARINQLERERNERDRELAQERDELERLQSQLDAHEEAVSAALKEAFNVVDRLDADRRHTTNPAIEKRAENVGMTPEEFLRSYHDHRGDQ